MHHRTDPTRLAKQPARNPKSLAAEAMGSALADARADLAGVQRSNFANAVAGSITGKEMVRAIS